jgi:hypothetical protein
MLTTAARQTRVGFSAGAYIARMLDRRHEATVLISAVMSGPLNVTPFS